MLPPDRGRLGPARNRSARTAKPCGESLDAASAGHSVGYGDASQFTREYKRLFGAPLMRDVERLREGAGNLALQEAARSSRLATMIMISGGVGAFRCRFFRIPHGDAPQPSPACPPLPSGRGGYPFGVLVRSLCDHTSTPEFRLSPARGGGTGVGCHCAPAIAGKKPTLERGVRAGKARPHTPGAGAPHLP